MGSCVFNLAIVSLMDIFHGPAPIFSKAEHGHILSAGFSVMLIGIASVSILSNNLIPSLGGIGLYTPVLIVTYGVGIRSVYLFEKKKIAKFVDKMARTVHYEDIGMREAVIKYLLNAGVIICAATWLPFIGDRLAAATGLGRTFFGTVFVAFTTSLPELVVSIAAIRIGAADMAVANLFGSNMFNILILAVDDIVYTKGPLLAAVSWTHAVTSFIAVFMTGIAIVSLTFRPEKKVVLRLGWDSLAMTAAYAVNIYLLYSLRGSG
jgi:cation:H+ antiporter